MESQQTPRPSEDPVMGRGSPMAKQSALSPGSGFQVRAQGHPPPSLRYPINNGAAGGPRLGGHQAPPLLHRLDSRSSLGSPTASGGQFVQSRPPLYGPPRPQNPQGNQIQGPRQPPPSSNFQGLQEAHRYPVVPGSPSVRPSPNNFAGQRPPIYNTNQPQQIYYQPRSGEIHSQRPANPELGSHPQIRFAAPPHTPETRHPAPQSIPETLVTPPPRNDWPLKEGKANNQSGGLPTRDFADERKSQPVTRERNPRHKMEVIDSRSSTPGVQEQARSNAREENDNIPKFPKSSPREESERHHDDDDDDVVIDREKELDPKIKQDKVSNEALEPESAHIDSPITPVSPASGKSYKNSASPSPVPSSEHQDRPASVTKSESNVEAPIEDSSNFASPSPVPSIEPQDRPASAIKVESNNEITDKQSSNVPSSDPVSLTELQDRPASAIKGETNDEGPGERSSNLASPSPVPSMDLQNRPVSAIKVESNDEAPGDKSLNAISPSPVPSVDLQDRPAMDVKVEGNDEPPGEKLSDVRSPIPFEDKSRETSRSESRLSDLPKDASQSMGDDAKHSTESLLKVEASDLDDNADLSSEKRSESRSSSVQSSRSPIPPRTPDHLSVLGSASPQLQTSLTPPKSPKSQKSPDGSVKGFDNGQLRSLSPKSSTPSAKSVSPNSPNSPVIPMSADGEKKKTSFAEGLESQAEAKPNNEEAGINDESKKTRPMTPGCEVKGKPPTPSKVSERAQIPGTPDGRKSSMKRSTSGRSIQSEAGSDSGANQTNQGAPTTNGVSLSPTKKVPSKPREGEKRTTAGSPIKSPSKSVKSLPRTPEAGPPSTADKKKVPMNKVQVGAAPSPNLKTVRSKIGSLDNASYKPGGGKVKIENRKLDFSKAQPKIAAKNDKYMPSGGDKKITQVKLQWNAKPKVGSLDNATYKPGGGDKKIETVKLDFKDKAKPKVGSKDNAKHVPGGGTVKSSTTPPKTPQDPPNDIETQKIDIKAESKIGSLDNVKHKPGGGDKKIFNDKDYLRQTGSNVESLNGSGAQIKPTSAAERPTFIEVKSFPLEPSLPPTTPTRSHHSASASPVTPRALRTSLEAKTPESPTAKKVSIVEEPSSSASSPRKSPTAKNSQSPSRPRTPKSPATSRPPSSLDARTVASKSPRSSRKSSPSGLHLPKLASTQPLDNSNEAAPVLDSPKIKLPKLLETSTLSSRVELTQ